MYEPLEVNPPINATTEASFWKVTYMTRPYVHTGFGYEEYEPAYRYGWESAGRNGAKGQTFESVESELSLGWNQARSGSRLAWDQAREATRDAWNRVQESGTGYTKILKD